jgi:hypothetical protein
VSCNPSLPKEHRLTWRGWGPASYHEMTMTIRRGSEMKAVRTVALASATLLAACAADFDGNALDTPIEMGTAHQAVAACEGDDVLYDYNAFAASLAVAIANELGRWDVNADFDVRNGKLELSTTGTMHCNASPKGCANVTAMLRLQDDASSVIPHHSPAMYRNKLTHWYQKQTQKLTDLVNQRLTVDKGVYKIQVRHSGKFMAVDGGSTSDGAAVEQRGSVAQVGADEWRLMLENTKHKFKNVRSGKCLTLSSDAQSDNVLLVQKACTWGSSTQAFEFAQAGDHYAIRTKYGMALDISGGSSADDARVIQYSWTGSKLTQQWKFVPVGTEPHIEPTVVANAVYYLTARHSGKAVGVDDGSLLDGASIEQGTYASYDDRFQWYVSRLADQYQLINRRSGKCLGVATESSTSPLVQQTCAPVRTQMFAFAPTGDGYTVVYATTGRPLEVSGRSTWNDARIVQGADGGWLHHRMFKLTPIIAGEPHRLTFSHTTNDANCGEYNYWYEISQPNGESLSRPEDTFVQLIFAGGKESLTGSDVNPFIAQQVSGDLVAIDPTYGLNETSDTSSGSCAAACTKFSKSDVTGQCCSCNGVSKAFKKSAWSVTTFLCQ